MEFKIPRPLKVEHDELHRELSKAIGEGGKTGDAARAVAAVLHPHFEREEEYALPPLGLLKAIAEGNISQEMKAVLAMTNRLKTDLHLMLEEHRAIVEELKTLADEALNEGKKEYARFVGKLILHAQTEEEVLYPAAILIGEYLKMKLPG